MGVVLYLPVIALSAVTGTDVYLCIALHRAKGNTWKGPFHLPRMQLACWQIAKELQDNARSAIG